MKNTVTFDTTVGVLEYLLNVRIIIVPAEIVNRLGSLKGRYVCTVNESLSFQCGMMAFNEGRGYITLSKARLKKLKIDTSDEIHVKLEPDDSKYGVEMPAELEEWLKQDKEAERRFDQLTPGKQRYLLNYITTVKSPLKRMERTEMLMANLKRMPEGTFNMRFLLGKEEI